MSSQEAFIKKVVDTIKSTYDVSRHPKQYLPRDVFDWVSNHPTECWELIKSHQTVTPMTTVDPSTPKPSHCLRVVCISDTHKYHQALTLPEGDILIHAGDFSDTGMQRDIENFSSWLRELPFQHKVVIAGNHDLTMHEQYYDARGAMRFHRKRIQDTATVRQLVKNSCTYLEDSTYEVQGIQFYGSPWQPEFCDWAFNLDRGEQCREAWSRIPDSTDILITHGPPLGHGDLCASAARAGCFDLLAEIQTRVCPALHVFGHIHEGYGCTSDGTTVFANASSCTYHYRCTNPALVFDISTTDKQLVGCHSSEHETHATASAND